MPQPSRMKYADDGDELVIEDESERVAVTGNFPVGTSVTGIVKKVEDFVKVGFAELCGSRKHP